MTPSKWNCLCLVAVLPASVLLQPFAHAAPPPGEPEKVTDAPGDDELSRKLLRKAQTGGDEDVMDTILRLMREAADNMEVKFDPGPRTQQVQKEILERLDEAIKAAALQRCSTRPPDSASNPDRRRMADGKAGRRQKDAGAGKPAGGSGEEGAPAKGVAAERVELPDGELMDVRRAWGHLPMREREEIIQGVGEEFLEKYRVWVERYYRALQEAGSESK